MNEIFQMTVLQLRKVFAQAAVELGVSVKALALSAQANVDNTPEALTDYALYEVAQMLTIKVKTGKRVLSKSYTWGGEDRMVDEIRFDTSKADAAVARCLAAAK